MCIYLRAFGLIPVPALMVMTALAATFAAKGYWRRWLRFALFLSVLLFQGLVLVIWVSRVTPAGAFEEYPFLVGKRVLDPTAEHVLMRAFWLSALFLLVALGGIRSHMASKGMPRPRRPQRLRRFTAIVLELAVLLCMSQNIYEFRRMGPSLARRVSPDGKLEVSLVPMNCMIDVNGVVIWRRRGEFWWRSLEELGDILTQTDTVDFAWDPDSPTCSLLLDGKCESRYDLSIGRVLSTSQPVTTLRVGGEGPS
jgi:hypothetical protein